MSYSLSTTRRFDKAVRKCLARGYDMSKLQTAMTLLQDTGTLPESYRSHKLTGYQGNNTWECHIEPDWLLVWEQYDDRLLLIMISTGTHSDTFGKKRR